MAVVNDNDMFRPPLQLGMKMLDRSKFVRILPINAARVFDNKNISRIRGELEKSKDVLSLERLMNVHLDPDVERAKAGKKCILLRPGVVDESPHHNQHQEFDNQNPLTPYSATITDLIKQELISVMPFALRLDYDYWTYHDIITSILPPDEQGEIPSGFSQVGHVAHLNLRDEYLKHKDLIAQIILDKNAGVKTVINKIDDVGEENEYRTFRYEVLAGPDDMNVEISEQNCLFRFDYSRVYWNSRLHTEHSRLVTLFQEGEAVCDVMAGIGPFAVPAGKKGIFVYANDLNPESYACLVDAVKRNKVPDYVKPFNDDGRTFIRTATAALAQTEHVVEVHSKSSRKGPKTPPKVLRTITQPKTFSHYVMNLPATALTFLPSFIGLYKQPELRGLHASALPPFKPLPLIHAYCFSTKSDGNVEEGIKICAEISSLLGYDLQPGEVEKGGVEIWDVRDVAPKKRMFCASFRLPEEVAFRDI
nr:trna (guanine(37)-n1)-methyltransferase [Quercus suber]